MRVIMRSKSFWSRSVGSPNFVVAVVVVLLLSVICFYKPLLSNMNSNETGKLCHMYGMARIQELWL